MNNFYLWVKIIVAFPKARIKFAPFNTNESIIFYTALHAYIYYIHERSQSHVLCVDVNDMSEIYITLPLFLAFHGCWEIIYNLHICTDFSECAKYLKIYEKTV